MNRIYRIVWSHTIGAWVVADERARARGKRSTTRHGLAAAVLAVAGLGIGGPGGMPQALADPCVANADLVQAAGEACTAMVVDGAVDLIDNSGEISGDGVPAIHVDGGSLGLLINRDSGVIDSNFATGTIRIHDGATVGAIDNQGVINSPGIAIRIHDDTTSITGGITNSGQISSGTGSLMIFGGASVTGGIDNLTGGEIISTSDNFGAVRINGSLTVVDSLTNDGLIEGNTYGLYLQNGATITGDVRNQENGVIVGNVNHGIHLTGSSNIGGSLVNSGIVTGGDHGLYLNASSIAGGIVNDVGGEFTSGNEAILIDNGSTVGSIINRGSIETSNADSALRVENSTITGAIDNDGGQIAGGSVAGLRVHQSGIGAIANSGLIEGGDFGVLVSDSAIDNGIDNQAGGELLGGQSGIRIGDGTTVDGTIVNSGFLSGGALYGLHVDDVSITGDIRNAVGGEIDGNTDAIRVGGGTTIGGSVINSGLLQATLFNGISLSEDSVIEGSIINDGSIQATDFAIIATNATVDGDIRNDADGEISGGLRGFSLDSGLTVGGSVINSGTMTGLAEEGIRASDTLIEGAIVNRGGAVIDAGDGIVLLNASTVGGGIHNEADGEIIVSDNGIRITGNSSVGMDGQGVSIRNAGVLQSGLTGIHVEATQISGDVLNASSGEIRSGARGIDLAVTTLGHLINDGSIEAVSDGIRVSDATVDGDIVNRGTILGEANGLMIDTATVSGGIVMDSGASIEATGHGIRIANSGIGSAIVNQGTITGGDVGIEILAAGSAPSLVNHGTIEGSEHALLVSQDSDLDTLTITGDSARFIGDVIARNTAVTLDTDAAFTNDNAFEVLSFHVSEGAVLRMGPGVTSSTDLDDGIATTDGFINDGTIEIAAGEQPVIHGNFSQGSDGLLSIVMVDAGDHGRLEVSDNAVIDGRAFVDASSATTLAVGQTLESVVSAGSLQGNFTEVNDNSLIFDFVSVAGSGSIDFEIVRGISVADAVDSTDNPTAGGAAKAIDDIIDSGIVLEGDMQVVVNALGVLQNEQALSDAMSQLLPLMTASQNRAIFSSLRSVQRTVQTHQGDAHQVWARPFGSWADQDNRKGVSGHEVDTMGVVIGADTAVGNRSRIGAGVSLARSDVDSKSTVAVHSADVDSFSVLLYGHHAFGERTSIDVLLDYGQHSTDGQRRIDFADLDRIARADYSSTSLHVGAGVSRAIDLGSDTRFTPSLRLGYTRLSDDAYEEQGADALGLQVDSHSLDEMILSLDGRVDHALNRRTTLFADLGIGYDLIDDQGSVTARLAGAPDVAFVTHGLDTDPMLIRAGLGFDSRLTDHLRLHARYDIESRSDFLHQGLSLQFSMLF